MTHSWTPVDLLAADGQAPEPPIIGPGLAYPGRRHVFSGEPESGKSWVALICCLLEIRAGNTAVYVDLEMGCREVIERLRFLGATDAELLRLDYIEPREPLTDASACADVRHLVADRNPSIVIVDAYTGALALHGLDPNSGVDIERLNLTLIDPLRAQGAATVILDHLPKNTESRGKFTIGSERKIGTTDVHLGCAFVSPFGRGRTGLIKVTTKRDRPGHLPRPNAAEIELASNPTTGRVTWRIRPVESKVADAAPFRPTGLMEKISRYLEDRPLAPVPRGEVERAISGKTDYIRLAIDLLAREEYIGETSGPNRSRLVAAIRPFRDDARPGSPLGSPHPLAPGSPHQEPHNQAVRPARPESAPTSAPQSAPLYTESGDRGEPADPFVDEVDEGRWRSLLGDGEPITEEAAA